MNPYILIGSARGTTEAASLSERLAVWHDAMVAHERRLRGRLGDECDDACAHGQARALWSEAVTTFGDRAYELSFLRSRATAATPSSDEGAVSASVEPSVDCDDAGELEDALRTGLGASGDFCVDRPATSQKRGGEFTA